MIQLGEILIFCAVGLFIFGVVELTKTSIIVPTAIVLFVMSLTCFILGSRSLYENNKMEIKK